MHRLLRQQLQRTHLSLSDYNAPALFLASDRRFQENAWRWCLRLDGKKRLCLFEIEEDVFLLTGLKPLGGQRIDQGPSRDNLILKERRKAK
ncbi:unnamed protein product [Lactuca virosa]|uniref:Uncharacterized protein n=1 Tax=Lactuca virosa TaxID=75947 RepID=A0AAU9MTB9_9ASTR|nr:unnamed protein product [Lactuca virosa]